MYRYIKIILIFSLCINLFGCSSSNDESYVSSNTAENTVETKAVKQWNSSANSNENTIEVISEYSTIEQTTEDPVTEPTTINIQNKVSVKVTGKTNIPEDIHAGRYSDFIKLTVQATNNTPSSIRGVQGTLYVDDLFGENIMAIKWDLTGQTIYSGQTVTYSNYGLDVNEFKSEHMKFYNTDFQDLKFRYEITQIVYGDGTSEFA